MGRGKLLVGAKGLDNTDFLNNMDPYVILTCRSQEKKSSVASGKGSEPEWNETFDFSVLRSSLDVDPVKFRRAVIRYFFEDGVPTDKSRGWLDLLPTSRSIIFVVNLSGLLIGHFCKDEEEYDVPDLLASPGFATIFPLNIPRESVKKALADGKSLLIDVKHQSNM
ncbi:hypothetical protein RND71_042882 [Anisodus tanguticus]|uniref:C2 domain-containing protein n=1 Tax=Anisodus tanguticus TaxID=243964 RepID=A0AAE1UV35_9SOLA|nr:hypothetical protein RND71_042882 [Anisodus tanguticus]